MAHKVLVSASLADSCYPAETHDLYQHSKNNSEKVTPPRDCGDTKAVRAPLRPPQKGTWMYSTATALPVCYLVS